MLRSPRSTRRGSHLDAALRAADHDPRELDRIEERLFALRAAGRKYNVAVDDLAALSARHAADLAAIDAGAEELKTLEAAARRGGGGLHARRRRRCPRKRKKAAAKLDKAVTAELKPLKLERARFFTSIETDAAGAGRHRPRRVLGARPIRARGRAR